MNKLVHGKDRLISYICGNIIRYDERGGVIYEEFSDGYWYMVEYGVVEDGSWWLKYFHDSYGVIPPKDYCYYRSVFEQHRNRTRQ